jgi:hypothetical protein
VYYLWVGDFNRHSALWDEIRNAHLFTAEADRAVALLLQLLGQHRMKMPLPQGVPTLRAKRTQNLTCPDNVFCSENFLHFFVSCNAYPARVPGTTDHFPVISVIDLVPPVKVKEERWDWRSTDWEELNKALEKELEAVPDPDGYATGQEVEDAIEAFDAAVWRAVGAVVKKTKVTTHSKRWWTAELAQQHKEKERLARRSYRQRDVPGSPVHEEYRAARNAFSARIKMARDRHWREWLEQIDGEDVWTAGQLMKSVSSDGGRTRIPDLRRGRGVGEEVATTNRQKSEWLVGEFYPKRKPGATDPTEDTEYPEPMWKYAPLSEQILHQVAAKMKPWKATRSGTFPNC